MNTLEHHRLFCGRGNLLAAYDKRIVHVWVGRFQVAFFTFYHSTCSIKTFNIATL